MHVGGAKSIHTLSFVIVALVNDAAVLLL